MSKRILWVSIESITVRANGDVPGQDAPPGDDKRNGVLATLIYPRSGAPTVNSGQQYNLPNYLPDRTVFHPDQTDFFSSGLFKEIVQDETILQIKITDTDRASKAEKIFFAILGNLVNGALTAATGGLTGFFGAIAGAGVDQVKTGMRKLGDDQVYVIGQTDKIRINVDNLPTDKNNPLRMALGLTVPDDVEKPYIVLGPTGQPETQYLRLPKGSANGEIVLHLAAVAADDSAAANA
jgi:hypothetical protein